MNPYLQKSLQPTIVISYLVLKLLWFTQDAVVWVVDFVFVVWVVVVIVFVVLVVGVVGVVG